MKGVRGKSVQGRREEAKGSGEISKISASCTFSLFIWVIKLKIKLNYH